MRFLFSFNDSEADVMERYEPIKPSAHDLQSYVGAYYNTAYSFLISFYLEDGQLVARNLDHQDIKFKPVTKDVFASRSTSFNAIEFLRDKPNTVIGFTIDTEGIHNLVFEKIKD